MTNLMDTALTQTEGDNQPASVTGDGSLYLYGITRLAAWGDRRLSSSSGAQTNAELGVDLRVHEGDPVQLLISGDLAAVVRPASLTEFGAEAVRERLHDAAWLEAMARSHHEVIAAIHREQAILPAKFGCVYAGAEDLRTALEQTHDALVAQLERLEDCDEWAVHIYADRPTIQRCVDAEHPTIQRLHQELVSARPGRAYFLQRKLADEIAVATDQALSDLAQTGYDHLVRYAVAGQVSPPARPADGPNDEIEILRAAFLLQRVSREPFVAELGRFAESQVGLRCEYSGPWPPYSFAGLTEEERQ